MSQSEGVSLLEETGYFLSSPRDDISDILLQSSGTGEGALSPEVPACWLPLEILVTQQAIWDIACGGAVTDRLLFREEEHTVSKDVQTVGFGSQIMVSEARTMIKNHAVREAQSAQDERRVSVPSSQRDGLGPASVHNRERDCRAAPLWDQIGGRVDLA